MEAKAFETPVAMFVFRRPDTTRRVFDAIANVKPARLLLIADGSRPGNAQEAEACQQVRDVVACVDWPCEVSTNFAESNLGCQERMISGLNWVFSLVEEAIILEDDCLPDPSFFPFCQQLLEKYRGDDRIAYISGCNLAQNYTNFKYSYYFSQIGAIWGWATWRSQWQCYDRYLSNWPELRSENILSEVFDQPKMAAFWTRIFDAMYEKRGPNTWDYQWLFTCLSNNSLVAVASRNLIANIGYGLGATHATEAVPRWLLPANSIEFPLKHPRSFIPLRSADRHLLRIMTARPLLNRITRKVRHITASRFRKT
jgi:hypothetical protein